MDLAMVLETGLLSEGLSTHLADIGLLPGMDVLMMTQCLAGGKGFGAVLAVEGLQLEMHGPNVRLQLELAGKEATAVFAGHLVGGVHQHVLDEHESLGQTTSTDLTFMLDSIAIRIRVLLHCVVFERVTGMEMLLTDFTIMLLIVACILRRLRSRGMLGATMILEIRRLIESGAAFFAHILAICERIGRVVAVL